MQVDSAFTFQQPTFEDFLNMELLAGPSSGNPGSSSGGSSRSSSHSPSSTHAALPPTPPNPFIPDITINDFYNFDEYMNNDLSKLTSLAPPPALASPFDIFNAPVSTFSSAALQSSSPDSGSGGSSSNVESPGIDPSLVGTPALSKSMSDFDEEEEENDDFEDLEAISENSPTEESGSSITPIKVGGKGKSARKGTVQSGGVVKKTGSILSKDKKENQPTYLTTTSTEPDDWRPTPEEYKKMSSKEKRQLRNKISARNFRVRRKEYINTLEGDIAERDRLIDHIRTELLGTKSENSALRQEIAALKKALLEGRGRPDTPILPPPAPLPSSTSSPAKTPKSPLLAPNTHKDLPTSPRLGRSPFWGGISGLGSGITPVHTTIVPEWSTILSGKPPTAGGNAERRTSLQENINPTLNHMTASTLAGFSMGLPSQKEQVPKPQEKAQLPLSNTFETFADKNMFTYKSMEDFRMQLWTRMGQQQALVRQQQQQTPTAPTTTSLNGLASNMRPHYFKSSSSLSALLSGKAAANAYPSPPPSPPRTYASPASLTASPSTLQSQPTPSEQQAMLASLASQTLVRKLGSAFWDAFSGGSSSSSSPSSLKKDFDADKVRKVLEGKAVVRVVDVEPTPSPLSRPAPMSTPLPSERLSPISSKMSPAPIAEKKGCNTCFSLLEEGIRNMHL